MSFLFLDTSEHLVLGLLDGDFRWIDYREVEEKKNSAALHHNIHEMLAKEGMKAAQVQGLFMLAGPGSYTGIRVAEGLGQVFEMAKVPTFSFYHHEIPRFLDVNEGVWISKAFKREYFFHHWKDDSETHQLVPEARVHEEISKLVKAEVPIYTHYLEHIDFLDCPIVETSTLARDFGDKVFAKAKQDGLRRPPYYYRALEDEFRVTLPDY